MVHTAAQTCSSKACKLKKNVTYASISILFIGGEQIIIFFLATFFDAAVNIKRQGTSINKRVLVSVVLVAVACAVIITITATVLITKKHSKNSRKLSRTRTCKLPYPFNFNVIRYMELG